MRARIGIGQRRRRYDEKLRRRRIAFAVWLSVSLWLWTAPGNLVAQNAPAPDDPAPAPASPATPGSSPAAAPGAGGFPAELGGDRPRVAPEPLRQGRIQPDSGVEVGAGPLEVSVQSRVLGFRQGPQDPLSDGASLSADIVLHDWRIGYSKILLRRTLESGSFYRGTPLDFMGVDIDQFWGYYGFRPAHPLYLGVGLAYEYRVTRLSLGGVNVTTVTENLGAAGLIADWAISPPITLQARVFQEDGGHLLTISGTAYQLAYIVPF